MSSLRSELHVAQQIRRDKLRIQNATPHHHLQEFANSNNHTFEQLPLHPGFNNWDLVQVRSIPNGNSMPDEAAPLYYSSQAEPRNILGNWRNSGPHAHQGTDHWMVSFTGTSLVNDNNPNPFMLNNNMPPFQHQLGEIHHHSSSSPALYPQNSLQDIVKSASLMHQGYGHGFPEGEATGNDPSNQSRFGFGSGNSNTNLLTNRGIDDNTLPPQGLSLSLSSNAQSKDPQHCNHFNINSVTKSGYRNLGPLGPFTGYATILKTSRFLKPSQQLLDELCSPSSPKPIGKACDETIPPGAPASTSDDAVNQSNYGRVTSKLSNSTASSCMFYGSNENSADAGGAGSSLCVSSRPEYHQQKKAKLLYMQEEVTRKYKQYHQQMQMVVSSFESVAGLSSATPYFSLALKSVSRHFRCLKNAISDQLRLIGEVLGEDLSIPSTSTSSKVDTNMARFRCMDQQNKSGRGNMGILEPQQHVWRPQRGLPERSVAILKAWLFEHFLHPYPTDTDKHMLATQTGLSRNQVSNWFINARVRVWKPMVEEIHMLETEGTITGANQNSSKNDGASGSEGSTSQPRVVLDKPLSNNSGMHANTTSENQIQNMELGAMSFSGNALESRLIAEQWNQEKRSKLECHHQIITSGMDGALMGFVPYRRGGIDDVGGLGSVSLTLGLRHGVEGIQHQQQQHLQQEQQLRRHFSHSHMIHDFVG